MPASMSFIGFEEN